MHVLATVDESTYDPGPDAMGADHPIAWWHDYDGGRSWYTAMGHTSESYSEPLFLQLLLGGIVYAAAAPKAPAAPSPPTIASLTTAVRARRVTVTVTLENCRLCTARATVAGRKPVTPLRAHRHGCPGDHRSPPHRPLAHRRIGDGQGVGPHEHEAPPRPDRLDGYG